MSDLHKQVMRLIDAGVPEDQIGAFIQQNSSSEQGLSWGDVPGLAIKNAPKSALRLAGDMVSAVRHLPDTVESIGGVLDSAENKLVNFVSGRKDGEPLTGWQKFWRLDGSEDKANAVGQYASDRYGGFDAIKNTLAYDPFGALADASTLFTGGAGVAKGIAKGAQLVGANNVASGLGRVAGVAGNIASATDPLLVAKAIPSLPLSGIMKVWNKATGNVPDVSVPFPERLYQSALKPLTTLEPDKRNAVVQAALREKIPPTEAGYQKLNNIIQEQRAQRDALISQRAQLESSGALPKTIDPEAIAKEGLDFSHNNLGYSSTGKTELLSQAESAFTDFLDNWGAGNLDTATAQKMKNRAQLEASKTFGENYSTPAQMANKSIARGLRMGIEKNVPEVAPINARLSPLNDLGPLIARALGREGNNNLISLGAPIAGGGIGSMIGGSIGGPTGQAIGALTGTAAANTARLPAAKANMAFILDSLSPTTQLINQVFSEIRPPATAGAYAGERAKESYADMLRRYGVNITLGQ